MSGSDALHSFVVPAYGRSPYLAQCLASLRSQTRQSRIVISTSTPFDGLDELAREYGARVHVHGAGGSIGRDWNQALATVDTPWATLAHQDDVYLDDFTCRTMDVALSRDDIALVMTGYRELLDDRAMGLTPMLAVKRALLESGFVGRRCVSAPGAKQRILRFGCSVSCPTVTLRMDRAPVRFREDLVVNLDWDAWTRLAHGDGAFAYVREVLMLHRIHRGSETQAAVRNGVRAKEDLMMFERFWPAPLAGLLARAYASSYEG